MSTGARNLVAAAVSLSVIVGTARPARADILDDIKAKVNTCVTRAIEARDRAKEARDKAEEIRLAVAAGVKNLTGTVRDVIAEGVDEAKAMIDEELEGRDAFVNGGEGETFRTNLITLLEEFETLFNMLATVDPDATPKVSFESEVGIIDKAPLAILWPLYRVLSTVDFVDAGLINRLKDTNAALEVAIPIFRGDDDGASSRATVGAGGVSRAATAAGVLRVTSVTLQLAGKSVQATNKMLTKVGKKKILAIHGYAGITIEPGDRLEGFGIILETVGVLVGAIGEGAQARLDEADSLAHQDTLQRIEDDQTTILENQTTILDNQEAILANQAKILEALTTSPGRRGR